MSISFPSANMTALPNTPGPNMPLSAWQTAGRFLQTPQDQQIIRQALQYLGQIQNLAGDEHYLYNYIGINPVFKSGAEALQLIQAKGIGVEFGDMGDSPAHAQWMADQNLIMINGRYRGDSSPETLRAIAEAIYHEAGHAKDGDGLSSVQEESDCLALNTMAHRYHQAAYPPTASIPAASRLVADGVAVYPKLFFDADPEKKALINRIVAKYGDLPLTSPNHPLAGLKTPNRKPIAASVAEAVQAPQNPQAAQGRLSVSA